MQTDSLLRCIGIGVKYTRLAGIKLPHARHQCKQQYEESNPTCYVRDGPPSERPTFIGQPDGDGCHQDEGYYADEAAIPCSMVMTTLPFFVHFQHNGAPQPFVPGDSFGQ